MGIRDDLDWLKEEAAQGTLLTLGVYDLPMSSRTKNIVLNAGAHSVGEFLGMNDVEFIKQPGCGGKAISAIRAMKKVLFAITEKPLE